MGLSYVGAIKQYHKDIKRNKEIDKLLISGSLKDEYVPNLEKEKESNVLRINDYLSRRENFWGTFRKTTASTVATIAALALIYNVSMCKPNYSGKQDTGNKDSTKQEQNKDTSASDTSATSTIDNFADMNFKNGFIVYAAGYDANDKSNVKGYKNVEEGIIDLGDSSVSKLNNELSKIDKDYKLSLETEFEAYKWKIGDQWVNVYNRLNPKDCVENNKDGTLCEETNGSTCSGLEKLLRIDDGNGLTKNLTYENKIVTLKEILSMAGEKVIYKIESDKTISSDMGVDNLVIMQNDKGNVLVKQKDGTYKSLLDIIHQVSMPCECDYEDGHLVLKTVGKATRAPTGVPDYYETNMDVAINATPYNIGVLANDSDPDGNNTLTAKIGNTKYLAGKIDIFNADGTYKFTPTPGFFGETGFSYILTDGCNKKEVNVKILVKGKTEVRVETNTETTIVYVPVETTDTTIVYVPVETINNNNDNCSDPPSDSQGTAEDPNVNAPDF